MLCGTRGEVGAFLTWHDGLLAFLALGRVLVRVAVRAEQLVLLCSEGLVHQRVLAPRAVEAGLMPVPVLVGQVLQMQTTRDSQGAGGDLELLCLTTVEGVRPTAEGQAESKWGQGLWVLLD